MNNLGPLENLKPLLFSAVILVCIGSCLFCLAGKVNANGVNSRSKFEIPVIVLCSAFLLLVVHDPNIMLNIGSKTLSYICNDIFQVDGII